MGKALHQLHVFLALVVRAPGQLVVQRCHAPLQLVYRGKGLLGLLPHGAPVGKHHHLGQVASHCLARHGDGAASGSLHAGDNLQQRALPGTVLAHQGDAVLVVDDEAGVREERTRREFHAEVVYRYHSVMLVMLSVCKFTHYLLFKGEKWGIKVASVPDSLYFCTKMLPIPPVSHGSPPPWEGWGWLIMNYEL